MKVYHATWTELSQGESLTAENIEHRLLSYYMISQLSDEDFRDYVEKGVFNADVKPQRVRGSTSDSNARRGKERYPSPIHSSRP